MDHRVKFRRIGSYVRTQRIARGWTQYDLSAASDVGHTTIKRLENAREVRLRHLCSVAEALGLTLGQLITRAEDA